MELENKIIPAYTEIAQFFSDHCTFTEEERENLNGSPVRVAKGLLDMVLTTEVIEETLHNILSKVFPLRDTSEDRIRWTLPIVQGPIFTHSLCPHHFLPVIYRVTYGYIAPEASGVLGLSKLTRIAKVLAKRPILQEQYTKDLSMVLTRHKISATYQLNKKDKKYVEAPLAGAVVSGVHLCMLCRGVNSPAVTTTEALDYSQWYENDPIYGLRGSILEDAQAKMLMDRLWRLHQQDVKVT